MNKYEEALERLYSSSKDEFIGTEDCESIDECKTNEELVETLCYRTLKDYIEKYKWHDLRKDPKDLPDEGSFFNNLLCVNDQSYYLTDCDLHYSEDKEFFEAESENEVLPNVIAWKYIEKFENE